MIQHHEAGIDDLDNQPFIPLVLTAPVFFPHEQLFSVTFADRKKGLTQLQRCQKHFWTPRINLKIPLFLCSERGDRPFVNVSGWHSGFTASLPFLCNEYFCLVFKTVSQFCLSLCYVSYLFCFVSFFFFSGHRPFLLAYPFGLMLQGFLFKDSVDCYFLSIPPPFLFLSQRIPLANLSGLCMLCFPYPARWHGIARHGIALSIKHSLTSLLHSRCTM